MTQATKKICDRCNKNEVTNGTSLCDKCYEDHNEIFGVTDKFNSKKENGASSGKPLGPIIIMIVMSILFSWVINSEKPTPVINTVFEEKLDYDSFPENAKIIYSMPQYHYKTSLNNHGTIAVKGTKDYAYLIKVIDAETKEKIYEIFIQPENEVTIPLMLGEYEIYLAAGKKWINEIDHFGKNTTYSRLDTIFNIYIDGGLIRGWTVELQVSQGGNLKSERISKKEWE